MPPGRRNRALEAALRSHIASKTPGLSSRSARTQLCDEIVLLALGVRRGILTGLTPTAAGPLALALAAWAPGKGCLRIWVHEPSRAVGILNVHRLAQTSAREQRAGTWIDARSGIEPGTLLVSLQTLTAHLRRCSPWFALQPSPPSASLALMKSLCSLCKRIAEAGTNGNTGSASSLVTLRGGAADAGVGFVGWLLGYTAPYSLESSSAADPTEALLVDAASYRLDEADAEWGEATPNNLCDVPLLLFRVELTGREKNMALYSFSVPRVAVQAVCTASSCAVQGEISDEAAAGSLCSLIERKLRVLLEAALQELQFQQDDAELEQWLASVAPKATWEEVCMPLVGL